MELMAKYPDKHFDLAIVDPPYFSGPEKRHYYGNEFGGVGRRRNYKPLKQSWSIPNNEYYTELRRVSKEQIIWGINYFIDFKDVSVGRIVWDKCNKESSFSDAEIASCSLHNSTRLFRFMWNGMLQGKSINEGHIMQGNKQRNQNRIHPTEKPLQLYQWLLDKYSAAEDHILDTHLGGGIIAFACHQMNRNLVAAEIDKNYYESACKRFKEQTSQLTIL